MTPQMIRTKRATQGLIASICIVASFLSGIAFLILSAVTDHPRTFTVLAITAMVLFATGTIIGSVKQ